MGGRRLRSSGLSSRRSPFPAPARRTRIPLRATQGSVRGSGGLHLVHTRRELRRSLRLSTTEGIVAELVGACASGATLTAWALYLGLAPVLVGLLGALPFIAQLVQIPSAWLTHVHGSRRTALWTIGVARQLPLALTFHVAWAAAGGVAAAFYPIHMIANLRMGFARMALYNGAIAAARIVAAPLWGRALDRVGARPVLVACCFGLCLSPVLWLFPREGLLWPLAIDAPLCGVLLAGQALASFSLPLNVSSRGTRSFHLAAFAAAGGLATGLASAAGGALAHVLPVQLALLGQTVVTAQILFLLGAALRFCAAGLALRIVEPGARPVQALGRLALNGALRRQRPARLDPGCAVPAARRSSIA